MTLQTSWKRKLEMHISQQSNKFMDAIALRRVRRIWKRVHRTQPVKTMARSSSCSLWVNQCEWPRDQQAVVANFRQKNRVLETRGRAVDRLCRQVPLQPLQTNAYSSGRSKRGNAGGWDRAACFVRGSGGNTISAQTIAETPALNSRSTRQTKAALPSVPSLHMQPRGRA